MNGISSRKGTTFLGAPCREPARTIREKTDGGWSAGESPTDGLDSEILGLAAAVVDHRGDTGITPLFGFILLRLPDDLAVGCQQDKVVFAVGRVFLFKVFLVAAVLAHRGDSFFGPGFVGISLGLQNDFAVPGLEAEVKLPGFSLLKSSYIAGLGRRKSIRNDCSCQGNCEAVRGRRS